MSIENHNFLIWINNNITTIHQKLIFSTKFLSITPFYSIYVLNASCTLCYVCRMCRETNWYLYRNKRETTIVRLNSWVENIINNTVFYQVTLNMGYTLFPGWWDRKSGNVCKSLEAECASWQTHLFNGLSRFVYTLTHTHTHTINKYIYRLIDRYIDKNIHTF